MTLPFGFIQGADGTVLLQLDAPDGKPGDAPVLALSDDLSPVLIRDGRRLPLSTDRPDLMRRAARAHAVHVVEFDGPRVVHCYPVRLSASGPDKAEGPAS